MNQLFQFEQRILDPVVGGVSALDISRLNVNSLDEAHRFIESYGYDWNDESAKEWLWAVHRRSVTFIRENLLEEDEFIPEVLTDPNQLSDVGYLLIYASTVDHEKNTIQKWSCAILRSMHVIVHLNNDFSKIFLEQIQEQVLKPIQDYISQDPMQGGVYLKSDDEKIRLHRFDIKPLKNSDSSIIKLLAKPHLVALNLLDTIGIRFVTRNMFDSFRVIRFLITNNIVSYPHIIPDQSANTLYPVNIFLEVMEEVKKTPEISNEEVEELLTQKLKEKESDAEYRKNKNLFSSRTYRFVKFITRKLISVDITNESKEKDLNFFYPYEVQIMDYETHINNISGPAAHDKYKERQKKAARRRLFGISSLKVEE